MDGLRFAAVTAYTAEDWHSRRILEALSDLGQAEAVDPADLGACLQGSRLELTWRGKVEKFDAYVLVRGLSPRGDADAQFSIYRALVAAGALVINRVDALLDAQDKFRTSHLLQLAGLPTPRAAVVQSVDEAQAVLRDFMHAVVKPLAGSLGEGVERLRADQAGEERVAQRLAEEKSLYLQEWVPNPGYDKRVLVVGKRVAGAVERVACEGEFRTNVARGATPRTAQLTPELAQIARQATSALGLDYAGIDILESPDGPQIIEVNGNPAFDMIWDASGKDMGIDIAQYVANRAREHRGTAGVLREREKSELTNNQHILQETVWSGSVKETGGKHG